MPRQLFPQIIQRLEHVTCIEVFVVFHIVQFHFAVVPWCEWPYYFIFDIPDARKFCKIVGPPFIELSLFVNSKLWSICTHSTLTLTTGFSARKYCHDAGALETGMTIFFETVSIVTAESPPFAAGLMQAFVKAVARAARLQELPVLFNLTGDT